jgi:YidC/Oxa1 family membrane protein insertase
MISDWSGISLEYAFTLERKVIFIDTPQKILNRNINKISAEPIEISIREKVGNIVSPNDLDRIPSIIQNLFKNNQEIKQTIKELRMKIVYNIGNSAEVGARYIQELNNKLSS